MTRLPVELRIDSVVVDGLPVDAHQIAGLLEQALTELMPAGDGGPRESVPGLEVVAGSGQDLGASIAAAVVRSVWP